MRHMAVADVLLQCLRLPGIDCDRGGGGFFHLAAQRGGELAAETRDVAEGRLLIARPKKRRVLVRREAVEVRELERNPHLGVFDF